MRGDVMKGDAGDIDSADELPRSRPVLSDEKILLVALEIAETDGLAALTMRAIGERLGADPTAVYRYFPKKADLVAAMADRLFAALPVATTEGTWRERIEELTLAARALYREHPTLTTLLATSDETLESLVRVNETLVAALVEAGLDSRAAALFHQVIVASVLGAAVIDSSWNIGDDDERATLRRAYAALPPKQYPALVANVDHLFPDADDVFDFTLQLVLDAIEATADRSTEPRSIGEPTT
jgi:AcrR family transcriptional regulator